MIVVIQCAASKCRDAGYFRSSDGRAVLFVSQPKQAPPASEFLYAHPDEVAEHGLSWRELLVRYNETPHQNPFGLLPAFALYEHDAFGGLVKTFGVGNVYILSAGWGLLNASFLTPLYDITFSQQADDYKRRRHNDRYSDLCLLRERSDEPMLFFGGKAYAPLFSRLSRGHRGPRTVFYNSAKPPNAEGCALHRFETTTRTNWHYECVKAVLDGRLKLDRPD